MAVAFAFFANVLNVSVAPVPSFSTQITAVAVIFSAVIFNMKTLHTITSFYYILIHLTNPMLLHFEAKLLIK